MRRKREAGEPVGVPVPDTKKTRLEQEGTNINKSVGTDAEWLLTTDGIRAMATSIGTEKDAAIEIEDVQKSGPIQGERKVNTAASSVLFKESPYTFLSPDDPILQSCM